MNASLCSSPPICLAALGISLALAGCESLGKLGRRAGDDAAAQRLGRLVITPPEGDEWARVDSAGGSVFVRPVDGMADIVSLFVLEETAPAAQDGPAGAGRPLDRLEDALRAASSDTQATELERSSVRGRPVLRYETLRQDSGSGSAAIREALGLRPRPSSYRYATRERGIFLENPARPGSLVKVGVARTSYHAQIGSHYDAIADVFIEQFVADNDTKS